MDELEMKVIAFRTMSLPGQPQSMHMGTMYLVNELYAEVERLRGLLDDAGAKMEEINDALKEAM